MNVIEHYDLLIDENNDPFRDSQALKNTSHGSKKNTHLPR